MNKPVIAITGATGFIGNELNIILTRNGYPTISLTRTKKEVPASGTVRHLDLREESNDIQFSGTDILIHCAYDFKDSPEKAINLRATKNIVDAANVAGVKKIIFFSSVTAHKDATSFYGQTKLQQESFFDLQRDVIIKSSLVVGNGGLFKRLFQYVSKRKYIPLVNKGRAPLQLISIKDVNAAVLRIIEKDLRGQFILANDEKYTYRSFFKTLAGLSGRKIVFLNINRSLLKVIVSFLKSFRIKFPVNSENIKGLESMIYVDAAESLFQLDIQPEPFEKALGTMISLQ